MRKLYVTKAGYWYLGLTVAVGVVALSTGNNVLYLIESMLMGGLILSGVISDKAISSISVELVLGQAKAGEPVRDRLRIRNQSRYSFFCIELGEWRSGKLEGLAFIPRVEPRSESWIAATRIFEDRGEHQWDGLVIATASPFGFAKKVRVVRGLGKRLIWPAASDPRALRERELARAGSSISDADVRLMTHEDDARSIVWKLSAKGAEPIVRNRRDERTFLKLELDLRVRDLDRFEARVSELAGMIYRVEADSASHVRLTAHAESNRKTLLGRKQALDFLALAHPMQGAQ